jgi:uncharacterized protein YbjQ (UPF0145 family)
MGLKDPEDILVATTPIIAGHRVSQVLDIVSAECVLGLNVFSDLFSGLRDFFGGRNRSTQNKLRQAKQICLREIREAAAELNADAVIGLTMDYSEFSGKGKSMLFLVAYGTAVRLEP